MIDIIESMENNAEILDEKSN